MMSLNKEASDWIYIGQFRVILAECSHGLVKLENNKVGAGTNSLNEFSTPGQDSKPGEIDLHGLYVKEAIEHTDQALQQAKQRGDSEVHLIVGA
jgi:hypothetical protein